MRISSEGTGQGTESVELQRQAKLTDAAQQFEAMMLQELLKPMQHGQSSWGEEGNSDDPASDTMSSFGTQAIASAISKDGGFGIAKQIVTKVTQERQRISER
jgi:peptidoglycan hydrolase FlgJ